MKLLAQAVLGRRGGRSSAQIINLLFNRPYNINQIATELDMGYNSAKYHVDVLAKYKIVEKDSNSYGSLIFLTPEIRDNKKEFDRIYSKLDNDK